MNLIRTPWANALSALTLATALVVPIAAKAPRPSKGTFHRIVLDREFRSEGVAVADVNRDGKPDILVGEIWYEAPNWTPHKIVEPKKYDGAAGYSENFFVFSEDVNHDGWVDELVIGLPGAPLIWRENPKGRDEFWKEHELWKNVCNESPTQTDLLGNRRPVFVFPHEETYMGWYEWKKENLHTLEGHIVSAAKAPGTQRFSHGLGVGDINGDGRKDILCTDGYWLAPKDRRQSPWEFVPAKLGPASAQMYVQDINGDGLPDVVASSAHNIGVWWYEQKRTATGTEFVQHIIDNTYSQTHSMVMADINGDGVMDFVTGKRFWAHGPNGDVQPSNPAMIYWYEYKRSGSEVIWTRHEVDSDSGVGTQFAVADVNRDGKKDIITSNKKGVYLHLQD